MDKGFFKYPVEKNPYITLKVFPCLEEIQMDIK